MEKLEQLLNAIQQCLPQQPQQPQQALPLAEQLLEQAEQAEQNFFKVQALRALAAVHLRSGRMEEAQDSADRSLELCRQVDDEALLLQCVITRGALYLSQARYDAARDLYLQYLPRSTAPSLSEERCKLINNLGVIERRLGTYPEALRYFLECVDLYRQQPGGPPLAYALHNLADVYIRLDMLDLAEGCVHEGLSLLEEAQVEHGRCYLLNNLGLLEHGKGHVERARALHAEALENARQHQDVPEQANSLKLLAEALDDPAEANERLREALRLTWDCGDRFLNADILLRIAQRLLEAGDLQDAEDTLMEALELSRETGSEELLCQVNEQLAELHAVRGDHRQAYRVLVDNMGLRDRIKGIQAAQRIQAITVPWELRAVEAERELLRLRNSELESLSRHDHLTGLANRRFLQQRLGELWAEGPLALLILDLDYFKCINDQYSHEIGDRVLQVTALQMQALCKGRGLAARFGGEEFVMLLPDCNLPQARLSAEELRRSISTHDWEETADGLRVTVSIGVAHSGEADTVADLLKLADRRLYQAKRSGRNRVSALDED